MNRKTLLSVIFSASFISPLRASVIYLKDGSRVSGTVVSATARDIQIHTDNGLEQTIPSERILRIDYSENNTPPSPPPPPQSYAHRGREYPLEQFDDLRQSFSFDLGLAAPLSRIDFSEIGGGSANNGDPGILLGVQYLYYTRPRLAWGFDLEYFNRGPNDSLGLLPNADATVFGGSVLMMGMMKYSLTSQGSVRPYLLAGLGTNHTSTVIDAAPSPGFSWSDTGTFETRRLVDDARWGLASTLRLGIDFNYARPTFFSFEVGWNGMRNGRPQATPAGQDLGLTSVTGNLDALTVGGRWGWRF